MLWHIIIISRRAVVNGVCRACCILNSRRVTWKEGDECAFHQFLWILWCHWWACHSVFWSRIPDSAVLASSIWTPALYVWPPALRPWERVASLLPGCWVPGTGGQMFMTSPHAGWPGWAFSGHPELACMCRAHHLPGRLCPLSHAHPTCLPPSSSPVFCLLCSPFSLVHVLHRGFGQNFRVKFWCPACSLSWLTTWSWAVWSTRVCTWRVWTQDMALLRFTGSHWVYWSFSSPHSDFRIQPIGCINESCVTHWQNCYIQIDFF